MENLDIGVVHDGLGWYFATFFFSPAAPDTIFPYHRLGLALFQQIRLERLEKRAYGLPIVL